MSTFNNFNTATNAVKSNVGINGMQTINEQAVNADGRASDDANVSNVMDQLGRSMAASQLTTQAALAQGEADRQASKEMALDAKKSALQEAMNKVTINGGNMFKAAAGA